MEMNKVIFALNSETRRKIIQLLYKEDMTAVEVFVKLKSSAPIYRQSINKALEILKECGLVEKYYDDNRKGLYYRLLKKEITLELKNMVIK